MNKKYFFFDIDGTLTDRSTKKIVPSALKTLQLLEENGHFVAIATGRAYYKAIGFMKEIGLHNMVCNGGHGLVVNEELIENSPLNREDCLTIIKQAEELGFGIFVTPDDSDSVYSKDITFIEQAGLRKEPTTYNISPSINYTSFKNIYKMFISIPEDKEYLLTTKDLVGHLRFEKEYLMFQPDNKRGGIERMMQYLGEDPKNVVVFGDDYNDMDMFSGDWYSIAMGNGCQALKDIASEVTESNVDDGIYNACLRNGWI